MIFNLNLKLTSTIYLTVSYKLKKKLLEDMIELITNQSKKLQKLEGTILKQDEKLNSFNKIISGELFN